MWNRIEYRILSKGILGRHRTDGPSVIYADGDNIWYIHGYEIDCEIHEWAKTMDIDLDNITDCDKLMIIMTWTEDYCKKAQEV